MDRSGYSLIDAGYASNRPGFIGTVLTGWYNGDFNYDGVVDGTDYAMIDNTCNNQGAKIAAIVATSTAQPANAAVPEPTSLGIIGVSAMAVLRRRKR